MYSEKLPSEWVVETSRPFMGTIISKPMNWSPESTQFTELQVKSSKKNTELSSGKGVSQEPKVAVVEINSTSSSTSDDEDSNSSPTQESGVLKAEMGMIVSPAKGF